MVPLKLLLVEDSEDDALLVVRALRQAGYDVAATQVDTADGLREALRTSRFDVMIADHSMPTFSGTQALTLVREHGLDLPFIFVSGTLGEDVAVASMKGGAHDYIVKGNLARLAPAVEREMRESAARRERTRTNDRVAYLAYHDPLTDLPNHTLLADRLHQAILTARREQKSVALLAIEIAGYAEVCETRGHRAGDYVLQQAADRLRRTLRQSDTIAHLGNGRFHVLLPHTDLDGAALAARKILQDFAAPLLLDGEPLRVHPCLGLAGFPVDGAVGHEVIDKAEFALLLARSDHVSFARYAPGRDHRASERLSAGKALRRGLDEAQFVLEYQPIVSLGSGRVLCLEALLRWDHPEQGRLPPEDFIRASEQAGLITPLTSFAIDLALSEWPASPQPAPTLAVNLSPRSLQDASFPARLRDTLREHGVDSSRLVLEITEDLIMADPERSRKCLGALHDLGIRLIVDDFGTGYSSLSYLRKLPVDQLKIDQSFVLGLAAGEDAALVRSTIDLAHNLQLKVIAEGVETAEVYELLRAMGCDAAQGHFVSRPAPAPAIARWMADRAGGNPA